MTTLRGPLRDVIDCSQDALTLAELGGGVLEGLVQALGCSFASMARCPVEGAIDLVDSTDLGVLEEYHRDWFGHDPVNQAIDRQRDAWIVRVGGLPEWGTMQRHPLYAEWAPTKQVNFLLHLRLSEARYLQEGSTTIFLGRSKEDGDFGERDVLAVAQVLPALLGAVTRCGRVAAMNTAVPFLESMLEEAEGRAHLAVRADGRPVWASQAAQRALGHSLARGHSLPEELLGAVRAVTSGLSRSTTLALTATDGGFLTVEVRCARASTGEAFAIVELRSPAGALPAELRRRFGLTPAEADVLADVAAGMSNAEIAQRRFVSVSTVRTHVTHVLSKLGVRSRLQACVVVRAML